MLGDQRARAGGKRLGGEDRALLQGEQHDLRLGSVHAQAPDRMNAGAARQVEVEHQDVRAGGARLLDHRRQVADLGDHLDVLLTLEQEPQRATHGDVVVGDQHGDRCRAHAKLARRRKRDDVWAGGHMVNQARLQGSRRPPYKGAKPLRKSTDKRARACSRT
jgi:hypothetical protein